MKRNTLQQNSCFKNNLTKRILFINRTHKIKANLTHFRKKDMFKNNAKIRMKSSIMQNK